MGLHRTTSGLFALGLGANGAFMLGSPAVWYLSTPGVPDTGPYNPHFVRDIGCAFLVAAIGFAWSVFDRERARPATLTGATFLAFHALVHFWDMLAGREDLHHLTTDLPAIFLPAALAVWLARPAASPPSRPTSERSGGRPREPGGSLFSRLVEPSLTRFERDLDYDTSYLRHVARTSGSAFFRFFLFTRFAEQREGLPADAIYAAKLVSVIREDCGPCTQLVVRMAEREGVPAAVLGALVRGDEVGLSKDATLAARFARAVLDRDVALEERLSRAVVETWGPRGLVSLAFLIASARVYPTLKYALGHGRACSRIAVGGRDIMVGSAAPAVSSTELASARS